jgi:opacity protein-like surface antigen
MKKIVLLSVFCLLTFQLQSQSLTKFGVKAGANFVSIDQKLDIGSSSRNESGFYIGAFVEFIKTMKLSIRPEVNYSRSTYREEDDISLLHIPLLVKYTFLDRLSVYGGPESQFLIDITNNDIQSDRYKKFILSFTAGLEIEVTSNFFLEGRYNYALSKHIDSGVRNNERLHFIHTGLVYKFDN